MFSDQSRRLEGTTQQSLPNTRKSETELTELNLGHKKKCMFGGQKENK